MKTCIFFYSGFFKASLNIFCNVLVVNFHHLSLSINNSFHFFNHDNFIISFFHFQFFIWIVRFSKSKSQTHKFIVSLTLSHAQYEIIIINLCFSFFMQSIIFNISFFVSTIGSFFASLEKQIYKIDYIM